MTDGSALLDRLLTALDEQLPAVTSLRRAVHRDPHLGHDEDTTADLVTATLGCADAPRVTTGRLVRVATGSGQAVAVRAELDALPIVENTGVEWAATNGAMHACGHDVHLAALVAVVRTLRRVTGPRPLLAVLQPREESLPCGAQDVVASGELAEQDVGAFVGVHVNPAMPRGVVACQGGAVNAAFDDIRIDVLGTPGHGAYPHRTRDPITAAAAVVTALNQLAARRIDPMHPTVVTIGSLHAGSASNAVAERAELRGTVRSFDRADRLTLRDLVRETAETAARLHGCEARVEIGSGEPVLVNDPALARHVATLLPDAGLDPSGDHRSCGADDFSFYTERFPSLMCFVGVESPPGVGLHHPSFLPPDEAIGDVARTMLAGYVGGCELLDRTAPDRTALDRTAPDRTVGY